MWGLWKLQLLVVVACIAMGSSIGNTTVSNDMCTSIHNLDCNGEDLPNGRQGGVWTHVACCRMCEHRSGCAAWTWNWQAGDCYLKSACSSRRADKACHSGQGPAPSPAPPSPSPPTPPPRPSPAPSQGWDVAYANARAMLSKMSREEKNSMLRSKGNFQYKSGYYVGNINAIERLGIPSLNMQDNGNGFRTTDPFMYGTVTCWPSALSLSATWDEELVSRTAVAMGQEFHGKGANVILGPGTFVHRVAKGGRNWESLSGEDPYLGGRLVARFVQGVQSQGVIATLKHFLFNQQENERQSFNALVDDKTAWELYYPPFQAGIDAGAGAVMCSYNREDGVHSCSNPRRLEHDLKQVMGFRGFVMSDWGAEHGTSIAQGEDMDQMNGNSADQFNPWVVSEADVNEAVTRTLAAIYMVGVDTKTKCTGGKGCVGLLHADVQAGHSALAKTTATESIVVLKNNGGLLPLRRETTKRIRIIGSAAKADVVDPSKDGWAAADFYAGGGSGHVVPGYHVTPYDGIKQRALQAGVEVVDSDDVDVTIVCTGSRAAESFDRASLSLEDNADELIASLRGKVVVLMQVPGAVLTPWRDSVQAIAASFFLGQETGSAWAAVLFGDHAPTGRLPLSFPANEGDTIEPGSGNIPYSEGLSQGYRNKKLKHAYAFGHGLTYTTFSYIITQSIPCGRDACITVSITNTGRVAAAAVPQLYVEFPAEARQPAAILKGFTKTRPISPGKIDLVTFHLTPRDLSYWANGAWMQVAGATAHVGAASDDIRTSVHIKTSIASYNIVV